MNGIRLRLLLAIASGALMAQVASLTPFWPLAWIAPVPLMLASIGARGWAPLVYGAIAGALSTALAFTYFLELAGLAPTLIIVALTALMWALYAFATAAAARWLPTGAAVFVLPLLVAGVETLLAANSPHGSSGSLAYSQMDFTPVLQAAGLGGAPAVSFIVLLFASALAFVFAKRALRAAIAPFGIVIAALAYGFMSGAPETSGQLRVAMLAANDFDLDADDWRPAWNAYAAAAEQAAGQGARLIVMPEKIAALPEADADEAQARFAAIARQHDVTIVIGLVTSGGRARFNSAWLFTPQGFENYDKRHMVPGFEDHFTVGTSDLVAQVDGLSIGVAICKDMDFPALGRGYGARAVDVMLVPAWDFTRDAWAHSRIGMLRGVENGYAIVRSARDGVMTVSDARGRVLSEETAGAQVTTLITTIPTPAHQNRLYTRIGDVFGWACLALAILLIGWMVVARVHAGQGGAKAN
ncbi:nitrilase-related carbon-nitrogen hydrolase [Terricaulis sp.]|uniref:nitrilase-related carbon-nitrogen hydrolase n=1 Tax=Terricaulis sp. TaxID=2768686 RepID=UPI0037842AEB